VHVVDSLRPDYLVHPRVSVQVLNYRPFYIIGEVNNPDSYHYVDGMTYLNAVAIAGGFTYRAKRDDVYVIRADSETRDEIKVDIDDEVQPGDIIRIAERFF
jgi:polysaccharide export outer membrane protein